MRPGFFSRMGQSGARFPYSELIDPADYLELDVLRVYQLRAVNSELESTLLNLLI